MTPKPDTNPLHEYEVEANAGDSDRLERLMLLKQAIASGQYQDKEILGRLIDNMSHSLSPTDDPD